MVLLNLFVRKWMWLFLLPRLLNDYMYEMNVARLFVRLTTLLM